jgi:anti-anti-sigma factor
VSEVLVEFKEPSPGTALVVVSGSATRDTLEPIEQAVAQTLKARPTVVTLDLAGLEFISSLAIGQFVVLASGTKKLGGKITTVNAQPEVVLALRRCKVDVLLGIPKDAASA